jgi:hypothetical protein
MISDPVFHPDRLEVRRPLRFFVIPFDVGGGAGATLRDHVLIGKAPRSVNG